jgi:hypothetical protein
MLFQLTRVVVVAFTVGWLYAWGAPAIYQQKTTPGFLVGCAHGAIMPMALPSLLMAKDVPIYAVTNCGRTYKIGYILGTGTCGCLLFSLVFWWPRRK